MYYSMNLTGNQYLYSAVLSFFPMATAAAMQAFCREMSSERQGNGSMKYFVIIPSFFFKKGDVGCGKPEVNTVSLT